MKKYRIGNVSRSTGITPFSMKHYEKHGLLEPQSEDKSGYRYYDTTDVGTLLLIRQLRQWNFTVSEANHLLYLPENTRPEDIYEAKIRENEAMIERLHFVDSLMQERLEWLRLFRQKAGMCEMADLPEFIYVPHQTAEDSGETLLDISRLSNTCAGFYATARFTTSGLDEADVLWGLLFFDEQERRQVRETAIDGIVYPAGKYCIYYYEEKIKPVLDQTYFTDAYTLAKDHGVCGLNGALAVRIGEQRPEKDELEDYLIIMPV